MTGIVTAALMPSIISGSLIRATPPSRRMSAGTRSSAITATAPASSATRAWSGVTTSMITPPFSISASPRLTRSVPVERCAAAMVIQCTGGGRDGARRLRNRRESASRYRRTRSSAVRDPWPSGGGARRHAPTELAQLVEWRLGLGRKRDGGGIHVGRDHRAADRRGQLDPRPPRHEHDGLALL